MKEKELKEIIFQLLKNIAPDTQPENLKPEDNIRQKLEIDSYDYLQFLVGLDEKSGIAIPEEDYGKIQKFGELVAYILGKFN